MTIHGFLKETHPKGHSMGLLPDTQNYGLRMRGGADNVFLATDFKGNR